MHQLKVYIYKIEKIKLKIIKEEYRSSYKDDSDWEEIENK